VNKDVAMNYITFNTPLGWLLVAESRDGIALVHFFGSGCPSEALAISTVRKYYPDSEPYRGVCSGLLEQTRNHILEYLNNRTPLPEIPLDLSRGTSFDRVVWKEIDAIAFGESRSYSQIAKQAQKSRAYRAVGRACGRNPVPILIPCHRVVGQGGKLGGFSGGLHIKKALLELETA